MGNFRKKHLAAAALAAAIMLSGCNGKLPFTEKKPDFNRTYTVSAQINCDRLTAKADVTRAGIGDWEFSFTEPKQLQGVKLHYSAGDLSASLGDLSFTADENAEYAMLPEIIAQTIDALAAIPSESLEKQDGAIYAETSFNGETVKVSVDESTGDLLSLSCPYYQLAVTFSGQKPYVPTLPENTSSSQSNV